jgi:hypothetical protein
MASDAKLVTIGPEETPVADLLLGHVSKEFFKQKWLDEWEGEPPFDADIEYQYAVPGDAWRLHSDVTDVGAVPVTVFIW